eukprot:1157900-Pelagomonas_calceolata.AAC.20
MGRHIWPMLCFSNNTLKQPLHAKIARAAIHDHACQDNAVKIDPGSCKNYGRINDPGSCMKAYEQSIPSRMRYTAKS